MKAPVKKYNQWLVELKNNIHQSRLQTALRVNNDMLILYWYIGRQLIQKVDEEGWGTKIIEKLSVDLQKEFPDVKGYSFRNLKYMRQFAVFYPDLLIGQQPVAQLQKSTKRLITQQPAALIKKDRKVQFVQQPVAQMKKNNRSLTMQQVAAPLENDWNNTIGQQPVAQFGNVIYFLSNPSLVNIPWGHHVTLMDKINDTDERLWYINKTIENNWSGKQTKFVVTCTNWTTLQNEKQYKWK